MTPRGGIYGDKFGDGQLVSSIGQAETPMSDHIARFWKLLAEGKVRILVDTETDGFGGRGYYTSSSFSDAVAKALVADHADKSERAWRYDELSK